MTSRVLVVGSLNMDLLINVPELPKNGETILGGEIKENPGGKGANQAVAIGKLNTPVWMLGAIGEDAHGVALLKSLKEHNVDIKYILKSPKKTGVAIVSVDDRGNNQIIVSPGANYDVTPEYVYENRKAIEDCDIVVLQLEIPLATVKYTLELAKGLNKITILNPAPAFHLDEDILKHVDILIPNEHELQLLTHESNGTLISQSQELLKSGVKTVIVTLGEQGCFLLNHKNEEHFPTFKVEAVDTTGAGDCFIGCFTSTYVKTGDLYTSIENAIRAASLSVTKVGAQDAMPTQDELDDFYHS
ncbi:ribokinase [Peribacillus acanthi]|uniref:ribokinase n=1 Tax=Peribacillus acanthi TaxID=2171554 RepID=UPI00130057F7|nr:ribokinase [Peribacillus acanthi]